MKVAFDGRSMTVGAAALALLLVAGQAWLVREMSSSAPGAVPALSVPTTPQAASSAERWSGASIAFVSGGALLLVAALLVSTVRQAATQEEIEARIQAADHRYERLCEALPLLVHSIDSRGHFIEAGIRLAEALGYRPEELRGRPCTDVLTERSAQHFLGEVLPRLLAGESVGEVPCTFQARDGRVLETVHAGLAELDTAGAFRRALLFANDSEALGRAQSALAQSEQRFRSMFERASVGLCHVAQDGRFLRVNPRLCELLGRSREELVGTKVVELTHPDDVAVTLDVMRRLKVGELDSGRVEKRYLRPDGTSVWAEATATLLPGEGEAAHFLTVVQDVGIRKRSEEALRASEQRLRSLLQTIPHGIQEIDASARIIFSNPAHHRMLGYDDGELTGRSVLELIPASQRPALGAYLEQLMQDRPSPEPYVAESLRKDGSLLWTQVDWTYKYGASGAVTGFIAVITDITERRRAEEALRRSEERLRAVVETIPHGVAEIDCEGTITFSNPAYGRLLGYENEELLGRSVVDFVPEERRADLRAYFRELVAHTPPPVPYVGENICKNGSRVWLQVDWDYKRGADGALIGFTAIVTDISERRRQEEALRASEARLNAFFSEAPAGLAMFDKNLRYVKINTTLARAGARTPEEHVGKTLHDIIPEIAPDVEPVFRHVLTTGEPVLNMETVGQVPSDPGVTRWWLSSLFPVPDASGATAGVGSIAVEISDQKRAEAQVREFNAELERRVLDRTEQLRTAQHQLLRKERLATLGQLIATVSHEIRNPLGVVRTSLFTVRQAVGDASALVERALARADRNIMRCDKIIDDLLDFTRTRGLTPTPTLCDDWLHELIDERQEAGRAPAVSFHAGAGDLRIELDRERLRQAVTNVLDNACQAAEQQRQAGHVTVSTVHTGERFVIRVSDNGPGIPDDVLPRICEPLFSTKNFGTGLGLSVARQILEQHAGGIEIHSKVGRGTDVTLWLPLSTPEAV